MTNVAVNIQVHVSVRCTLSFLLHMLLGVGLPGHMGGLCWIWGVLPNWLPRQLPHVTFHQQFPGFQFLHIFTKTHLSLSLQPPRGGGGSGGISLWFSFPTGEGRYLAPLYNFLKRCPFGHLTIFLNIFGPQLTAGN